MLAQKQGNVAYFPSISLQMTKVINSSEDLQGSALGCILIIVLHLEDCVSSRGRFGYPVILGRGILAAAEISAKH